MILLSADDEVWGLGSRGLWPTGTAGGAEEKGNMEEVHLPNLIGGAVICLTPSFTWIAQPPKHTRCTAPLHQVRHRYVTSPE